MSLELVKKAKRFLAMVDTSMLIFKEGVLGQDPIYCVLAFN